MTWLTAFHLPRFSCLWGRCQSPRHISRISLRWRPVFFVSLCTIEMSGVFSLSSRMLKLGCEAGSHVCFGRITCLLLWDGLLITHTLPQHMPLMQSLSMSVCESVVQVSGHTINNVARICDISACKRLACDCFIKKNYSDVVLCVTSASDGTPTDCPSLLVDCLMHNAHKSTFLTWQALVWLKEKFLSF